MNRSRIVWLLSLLVGFPVVAAGELVEEKIIERSFAVDEAPVLVVVDGFRGEIAVTGHDSDRVVAVARETVRARSQDTLAKARREVSLEITEESGLVELYVDGPFRDRDRRRRWRDPGYAVQYDFELTVPGRADLRLATVLDGEVRVQDVHGGLDVSNVNEGITLSRVGGTVVAETVNGGVKVDFVRQPDGDCRFTTVNGDIVVSFPGGLSADLLMKTRFGEMWSEHPVEALPSAPATRDDRDGRTVIRTDPWARVRAGNGGPQHTFETLNGDVVLERSRL